jgi:hypothetical protein
MSLSLHTRVQSVSLNDPPLFPHSTIITLVINILVESPYYTYLRVLDTKANYNLTEKGGKGWDITLRWYVVIHGGCESAEWCRATTEFYQGRSRRPPLFNLFMLLIDCWGLFRFWVTCPFFLLYQTYRYV